MATKKNKQAEQKEKKKREQLKKLVEGAGMGLGFFVLFGIVIIPGLREKMGTALNVVLGPLAEFVGPDNFLVTVLLLTVVTGIYTSLVQKYTMNWELMEKSKKYQKQMREIQKEYFEARKEKNSHRMKRLEKRREEVMSKQAQFSGELMKQQMKPMAYIGIITFPVFMWLWKYAAVYSGGGTVIFPLIGTKELTETFVFSLPYWMFWYLVCSFPLTVVIRKALGIKSAV